MILEKSHTGHKRQDLVSGEILPLGLVGSSPFRQQRGLEVWLRWPGGWALAFLLGLERSEFTELPTLGQPWPLCSRQTQKYPENGREAFWLGGSGALYLSVPDGAEPGPCLSPGPNLNRELHSSGGRLVPCRNAGLGGEAEALGMQREFQCALLSAWSWKAAGYFGLHPALALHFTLPSTPNFPFSFKRKKNPLIRGEA